MYFVGFKHKIVVVQWILVELHIVFYGIIIMNTHINMSLGMHKVLTSIMTINNIHSTHGAINTITILC